LIAETKGESFYHGELAERIAAFAVAGGAALTGKDLAAHRNDWCGTISQDFADATLHEIPPNGHALGILKHMGVSQCKVAGLEHLGHRIIRETPQESFGFGGAQLVHAVDGGFVAGADPRKDGYAAGF
jgi:gamma-glutamyltranspeptidase